MDSRLKFDFSENYAVWVLARHFGGSGNMVFPNVHLCGGEMDLAVITKAGYLWEIEIKRSVADWRADERKSKWSASSRKYVTRFFYAVPPEIVDKQPSFVADDTGLLEIDQNHVRTVRDARRRKGPKLEPPQIQRLLMSTYYRFWNERNYRHFDRRTSAEYEQSRDTNSVGNYSYSVT